MWEDRDTFHSLGIVVRDTHYGNYLEGKLVGFNRAWTMYHPVLTSYRQTSLTTFERRRTLIWSS